MTSLALDAALSGLKAAQRSLDTISSNIANASTAGYTRKILPQETLIVNGMGLGAKLKALERTVDQILLRDTMKQYSISEGFSIREQYLARVQAFHGASDDGRSISTRVGELADAFSELSSAPDSTLQLSKTLASAQTVARTFNEYSDLLTDMRTQAEEEIAAGIEEVNRALTVIAELNIRIASLTSQGQSSADLEDQRDIAIKTISQYMQVSTYKTDNNKVVVMTRQGRALADETARTLLFNKSNITPGSYYPGGGLSGITISSPSGGTEITSEGLGGKIGALIEMRDVTVPTYQAQMDEMAQKLASRLDAVGLRLFTDGTGQVPASVAPPAPVGYVGFSGTIRVNPDIENNIQLLRQGTYGEAVLTGSNEIIRRVSEFAFGSNVHEEARGTVDISAGTLFATLGLTQTNELIGNVDLTDYAPDLDAALNITAPTGFTLTIGVTPYNINIAPGDTATDLVNTINAAVGSPVAVLNGLGQLRLNATAGITLSDNGIGAAGMADLGFSFGVYPAQNPSFTIQRGTQNPVTITIAPGDTATDLLNDLNAISGIDASLGVGGELIIVPERGGDLTIANVVGTPLTAMGVTVAGVAHTAFRQTNLGPDATISTNLLGVGTIESFARASVTSQGQDHSSTKDRAEKEQVFFETLDKRNSDTSGVDIDQEVSELVRIQTAYTAAARVITASERMFDELLAAFVT